MKKKLNESQENDLILSGDYFPSEIKKMKQKERRAKNAKKNAERRLKKKEEKKKEDDKKFWTVFGKGYKDLFGESIDI